MTRRLGKGDAQRGRARLALSVVIAMTTMLLIGLSPGGPLTSVLAAVNGTPTATTNETNAPAATTTPAPASGPTIQLINPSKYVTPVTASNKADDNTTYHLVAWVGNVGAVVSPFVEFQIQSTSGGTTQTIPATRVGTTDTWEAQWTFQSGQADGPYNVLARLFGGDPASQVATDSEEVTIEREAETVEMSYPLNGGTLGTFDPIGPAERGFVIDATVSSGATGVQVFYGTSPSGTEQNWRRCTIQETVSFSAPGNRRIGCTVASGVGVFDLTGVAIVATGTDPFNPVPAPNCSPDEVIPANPPQCPTIDSGDAHRVTAYEQIATSVSISPPAVSAAINTCQVMSASLLDNQGRPIWRANMDVHAAGPTDDLQFGRVTGQTRDWQPADASGRHDGTEPTHNCGGMGTPPAQSEHVRPSANDDKHIETKPADQAQGGTDTSGLFTFALRSPAQGTTNVEAWADSDDSDDRGTEPIGTAAITWTAPTPSQSASASGSASATASATASRSPSATRSPSASASATSSPTSSSSPQPSPRTISLESNKNRVKFGRSVVFSGVVNSSDAGCRGGQIVKVQQQTIGAPGFTEIATATTDGTGFYRVDYQPAESATYRAVVDPSATCQEATSSTKLVLVRTRVGLRASDNRVRKGAKVTFRVTVAPCGNHAGTDVTLERNTGRGFKEIGRKAINADCATSFKKRIGKTARFRARWPSQDDNHEAGTSPTRKVTVKPPRVGRRNFSI
jgi:hypothetical protein